MSIPSYLRILLIANSLLGATCFAQITDDVTNLPESSVGHTADNYTTDDSTRKAIANRIAAVRSANTIRAAYADDKGDLWFSSNQGVYRYDGESFINLSTKDGLSDNQITSIMQDHSGDMWFGVPDGLCRFDGKIFTHIPVPYTEISTSWLDKVYPVVNPNQVLSMLQDRSGDYWIGTNGGGAYHYDGETFTSFLADHGRLQTDGLYHNAILNVTEDTRGNIWFTSLTHGGVSRYDGTTMRHFKTEDGLSDNVVRSAYSDRSGNVWFGSNGNRKGGLDRFDGKNFTNFNLADGLSSSNTSVIFEDSTGKLWVGSHTPTGSLCIFDGERFSPFTLNQGQTFEFINFIIEDAQANIWFGGNHGQLFRYDGEDLTDFSLKGK